MNSGYSHTNSGSTVTALDQGFTYDNLDRLASQTVSSTSYGYSYDATGNRTSRTISGNTYTNTVAANSNRITQTQDVTGTATPQYDAAGNTTSDGMNTYAYSDRGRMASAVTSSGNVAMVYNGLEQRAYKNSPLRARYYVRDEGWNFLGEYDSSGAPVYETIYLGSTPVGVIKQGVVYNVYTDQIDTPRVITKQDHTIVWRWDTAEAFGATAPNHDPSGFGAFVFNQCMPGQVRDRETGLCDNGYRTYDPRGGRYIQFDRIGLRGGVNGYTYVRNSPTQKKDPTGLFDFAGHVWITNQAAAGLPNASDLSKATALADFLPVSQLPENSFWHAMRDGTGNQTVEEARDLFNDYIESQLGRCDMAGLARALHAVQDSFAAGHRDFQPWAGGSPSPSHLRGDMLPSPKTYERAVEASRALIERYQQRCECKN